MKKLKTFLTLAFIAILSSCSKSDDAPAPITPTVVEVPTFKQLVSLTNIFPNDQVSCLEYSGSTKNIYVLSTSSNTLGFKITQINIDTKQATIVYNSPATSAFAAPETMRIFGNSIYIPQVYGGKIYRLDGIGTNTLALGTTITPPATGTTWSGAIDIAIAGKMYAITGNKVTIGDSPSFTNLTDFALSNPPRNGATIIYSSINNNAFLLTSDGEQNGVITAYNPVTGAFIRSVLALPFGNNCLVKDSQGRIYNYGYDKIVRYSADLLTKEEFPYTGGNGVSTIRQISLIEEGNKIKIIGFNGVSVPNGGADFGIDSITIPN